MYISLIVLNYKLKNKLIVNNKMYNILSNLNAYKL